MPTNIKQMNIALYNASIHLINASKSLSDVPEFANESLMLITMAHKFAAIIKPETRKVTEDRMKSIMDEIINFNTGDAQ